MYNRQTMIKFTDTFDELLIEALMRIGKPTSTRGGNAALCASLFAMVLLNGQ